MTEKRERIRAEIKEKGIPLAKPDENVIWDDPILKVPFTSNPFISRLTGKARLDMVMSYGLYYNELTEKWSPITATTMADALIKGRYYPTPPDALTELSDNPLRSDNAQNLMVVNKDIPLLVSDLTFLDTTKLSVKDADALAELVKLTYLDTTKLSVKDADALVKLTSSDTNISAIKAQTDKLQFDGSNNLKCVYAL